MNIAIAVSWLSWMVQRLPRPLLARLDAWSRDVALRRAEQRRLKVAAGLPATAPVREERR